MRVAIVFIGWMLFFLATMALGEAFITKVPTDLAEPLGLLLLGLGFMVLAYMGGKGLKGKK